jgi:tryptophan-rich sensory protein
VYGRRKMCLINGSLYLVFTTLSDPVFQPSINFLFFFIFAAAFVNLSRSSAGYIMALEFGDEKTEKVCNMAMVVLDGTLTLTFCLIFYLYRNIAVHLTFVFALGIVALMITYFWMPESPAFLFTAKKFDELEACF